MRQKLKFALRKVYHQIINRLLSRRGIRIHPSARVSLRAIIETNGGGEICIGANCEIHPYSVIKSYGGKVVIGNNCSLNMYAILNGHGGLQIGNGVRIASHTVVIPSNHVIADNDVPFYLRGVISKGIEIQDNVWLGAGCIILDNVTIGENSVIAAGAVVNKDVDRSTMVGGVPCKVIKKISNIS